MVRAATPPSLHLQNETATWWEPPGECIVAGCKRPAGKLMSNRNDVITRCCEKHAFQAIAWAKARREGR